MAKFYFYQDVLVKMWTRNTISVEAENEEEAIKILEKYKDEDIADLGWDCEDKIETINLGENLFDTESVLTKEENQGRPTIEFLNTRETECILHN